MRISVRFAALALGLLATASVHAVRITPAHSGSWFDPAYDKQGFAFEVLGKSGNGPERFVAVYWYTYDDEGAPVWAVGMGETAGDTVELLMQRTFGGARPPLQVPADDLQDWAEMTFTFGTCNTAVAEFTMVDSGEGGRYELQRLTQIGATTCTGGMADEVEAGAEPVTLVQQMVRTGVDADAQGKLKFVLRPAYAELEVDVQKLDAGSYLVFVGGEEKGSIQVTVTGNGNGIGKGTLVFRSPGEPLLDFDPRGLAVDIVDADGEIVLTATLPAAG